MKTGIRMLALAVSLVMLLTGPLAPLANAQQPAPPPPGQPIEPIEMKPESHAAENAAYNIGAGVANAFYVPGKAVLCGLGGMVGIFVMIVSVGSARSRPPSWAKISGPMPRPGRSI